MEEQQGPREQQPTVPQQPAPGGTKTTLGLDENVAALLCYVFGWLSGLVFLLIEKENSFVRFHAFQALFTFLGVFVISVVAAMIPYFGWVVSLLMGPLSIVLWVILMIKAFRGEQFKLPFVGDLAEQQVMK